jgi:biopolymer transport protein TolQ
MPDETLWTLISRTFKESGGIEQAVFLLLMVLSLASWSVMLYKFVDFFRQRGNNRKFLKIFEDADTLGTASSASKSVDASPLGEIFSAGMAVLEKTPPTAPELHPTDPRRISMKPVMSKDEWLRTGLEHAAANQIIRLKKGLGFLATLGTTAPFIGLFGTVWGIMATFRALGAASSTSLSVVAPGISASLIATAAGLAVAIPAVIGYNYFLSKIEEFEETHTQFCENFFLLVKSSGYWQSEPAQHSAQPAHPAQPAVQPAQPYVFIPTPAPAPRPVFNPPPSGLPATAQQSGVTPQ